MNLSNKILALLPLIPPFWLLVDLFRDEKTFTNNGECLASETPQKSSDCLETISVPMSTQLVAYVTISIIGFISTHRLIPNIKVRTFRREEKSVDYFI